MANEVFNIAKGQIVEYYRRVKGNDPANSGDDRNRDRFHHSAGASAPWISFHKATMA